MGTTLNKDRSTEWREVGVGQQGDWNKECMKGPYGDLLLNMLTKNATIKKECWTEVHYMDRRHCFQKS